MARYEMCYLRLNPILGMLAAGVSSNRTFFGDLTINPTGLSVSLALENTRSSPPPLHRSIVYMNYWNYVLVSPVPSVRDLSYNLESSSKVLFNLL